MKTVNFKRSDSALRVWDDDPRARKRINWDRIIYIILLAIVLFFGGRYLINRFLYVNATGHILFEKRNIRNVDDCQLLEFFVNEGDSVKAGDTLFSYLEDNDAIALSGNPSSTSNGSPISISVSQSEGTNADWRIKEIYNLKKNISSNRVRIEENEQLLKLYKTQRERIKEQVILDVTLRSKMDELDENIKSTEYEISRLKSENSEAAAFINQLNSMNIVPANNETAVKGKLGNSKHGFGETNLTRFYYSPIDGTVTKINFKSMEAALKSEIILSIHKPENIYIKAFFKQTDIKDININDEVAIEFPDGTQSKGIIKRFYYSTNALPEEFQKKYEPTTRTLLADVVPLNDQELKKWRFFYRMGVKISKFKY